MNREEANALLAEGEDVLLVQLWDSLYISNRYWAAPFSGVWREVFAHWNLSGEPGRYPVVAATGRIAQRADEGTTPARLKAVAEMAEKTVTHAPPHRLKDKQVFVRLPKYGFHAVFETTTGLLYARLDNLRAAFDEFWDDAEWRAEDPNSILVTEHSGDGLRRLIMPMRAS